MEDRYPEFTQDEIREVLLELVDEGVLVMGVDPEGDPADGTWITFAFADDRSGNRSDETVAVR